MKMVLAIVQAEDAHRVVTALVEAGHRVTRVATTGGWLRRENATLLMGVEDDRVDEVLDILCRTGQRRTVLASVPMDFTGVANASVFEVEVGGATAFVLNVTDHQRF